MGKIRLAIIGCGNMGKKHLSVLQSLYTSKVEISGILNSSLASSEKTAKELGSNISRIWQNSITRPLMVRLFVLRQFYMKK